MYWSLSNSVSHNYWAHDCTQNMFSDQNERASKINLLDISVFENGIILIAGHSKCDVLFVCACLTAVCDRVPRDTFVFVLCVFVLLLLRSLTSEGFEKSRSLNNIAGTHHLSPVTSPCPIRRSRSPIPSIFWGHAYSRIAQCTAKTLPTMGVAIHYPLPLWI